MARKRSEKVKAKYTVGSVFHALNLPEADDLVVKADLVARIDTIIRDRGLTQVRAAALLGMDQPKVSALLRGRLDRFSIERLVRALRDLGQDVQLTVTSTAKQAARPPDVSGRPGASRDAAASRINIVRRRGS